VNPSATVQEVACILIQNDNHGRVHPIYYASRALTATKCKYNNVEKLVVALLFGCMKFKHYMFVSSEPVNVQCSREGLRCYLSQTYIEGRVACIIAQF
jgi:hypothetical protein